MNSKISVVILIDSLEEYVKETVNSIITQSYANIEILLTGNFLYEEGLCFFREILDKRIHIIDNRESDYNNVNRGIKEATGEYITIIHAGDIVPNERFEIQIKYLDQHSEIGALGGGASIINTEGVEIALPRFVQSDPDYVKAMMMFECPIILGTVLIKKSVIDKYHIMYDTCLGDYADSRFLCEVALRTNIANMQGDFLRYCKERMDKNRIRDNRESKRILSDIQEFCLGFNGFQVTKEELNIIASSYDMAADVDISLLCDTLKKIVKQAFIMQLNWRESLLYVCRNHYLDVVKRAGIRIREGLDKLGFSYEINEKSLPLVSVVIPTYNRADKVERSIYSVLNQTYRNVEIIIVDDGSTDSTEKVISNLICNNSNIYYYKMEVNGGPASARNYGVARTHGDYIAFHDDDDEWHPDKLFIQMTCMLNDSSVDMTFGQMSRYNDGEFVDTVLAEFDWYKMKDDFHLEEVLNNYVGAPTIVIKKEAFECVDGFTEKLNCLEDWDFAIRASKKLKLKYIGTPLMDVNISKKSVTHDLDGYVYSWSYILRTNIKEVVSTGRYISLMKKHLRNTISGSAELLHYLELVKESLTADIFDGSEVLELIVDTDEYDFWMRLQKQEEEKKCQLQELTNQIKRNELLQQELAAQNERTEKQQRELICQVQYSEQLKEELLKQAQHSEEQQRELIHQVEYSEQLKEELLKQVQYSEEQQQELLKQVQYSEEQQREIIRQMQKVEMLEQKIAKYCVNRKNL